jgi:hypothetical protein
LTNIFPETAGTGIIILPFSISKRLTKKVDSMQIFNLRRDIINCLSLQNDNEAEDINK